MLGTWPPVKKLTLKDREVGNAVVLIAALFEEDKKQLNRIERKLDKLLDRKQS